MLSAGEKINVILKRKNINKGELAEKIGSSRQNLSNKFKRDNFSEKELLQIAEALDVELEIRFIDKESGELII
ncbi:MAG: bacteriophage CI repressor [Firmicutes bacterium]|nr:bacteriophage CI repressor [Bacillota bacterium]